MAVHILVWITAWSSVLTALVPAVVWRRREPGTYADTTAGLLRAEAVFVVLATVMWQEGIIGLIRSIPGSSRFLVSSVLNGLVYITFAVFLSRLPAVFLQNPVDSPSRKPAFRAVLPIALPVTAGVLAGFNILSVAAPELVMGPFRMAASAGWFLFGTAVMGTVVYAGFAAFRDARRLPWTRSAAVLVISFFACFFAFELLPQLGLTGSDRRLYFALPLGLVVLNAYLAVNTASFLMTAAESPQAGNSMETDTWKKQAPADRAGTVKSEAPDGSGTREGPIPGLSTRESQIARLLADGKTYKEIASSLHISLSTVQTHVFRIYSRLGVSGKMELFHRIRKLTADSL